MGEVKSAFEKAMEKVEKLGKASPEELKRAEYLPQGNTIAARYLRGDITDLVAELSQHGGEVRNYLVEGVLETFLRNISLPRDTRSRETSSKAMDGILVLKDSDAVVKDIFDHIKHLFTYYEASAQQAFTRLRQEFEAKLGEAAKAAVPQLGAKAKIDVERQPQFQEAWRKARAELDAQYEKALEEHKQRLRSTT